MYQTEIVTDLASEPVSLPEVKQYCGIDEDYSGDDALLTRMLKTARLDLEKHLGISFGAKTLKLYTDQKLFELPYGPVTNIVSVKDKEGNDVEFDQYGENYPKIDVGVCHTPVIVTYEAGDDLLDDLRQAVCKHVKGQYDKDQSLIEQAKKDVFSYSRNLFI